MSVAMVFGNCRVCMNEEGDRVICGVKNVNDNCYKQAYKGVLTKGCFIRVD